MTLWQRLIGRTRSPGAPPMAAVLAEARSHTGHVRTANEDRFLSRTDRGLWAVADGMGGHGGGEAAASLAISALEDIADGAEPLTDDLIRQTLQRANGLIHTLDNRRGAVSGTTIVAARRDGAHIVIYWAGDSRAYRVSGGKVRLVTNDHSVVQEMIEAGVISKAEAVGHPQSNLVTRALGVHPLVEVDTVRLPFRPGDRVLLCSDGLSRSLTGKDLSAPSSSLAGSADALLGNALRRDGSDNTTLVLIERCT